MRLTAVLLLLPLGPAVATRAPLLRAGVNEVIPDRYIVKLKDNVSAKSLKEPLVAGAEHVFQGAFNGFSATLKGDELEAFLDNPNVEYIEQDATFTAASAAYTQQPNAPWGLARISSRTPGATTYVYDTSAGEGTCAYIVDTGVDASHPDFGGRASQVANFADSTTTDGNGHGTHIAGIIGGSVHGVAKQATLLGVKVLSDSGSGSTSGVLAGLSFTTEDAPTRSCPNGVVVNLSIGGAFSTAMNAAAASLVDAGFFVSVASGNQNDDAGNYSPASEPSVCTVGGSDRSDGVASSNFGAVIDVFAPGRDIPSTWIDGGVETISGTSMAAAHVAGLGAYLGALEGVTGEAVCARIQELATEGALIGVPAGTVNLLAFNGNPSGYRFRRHLPRSLTKMPSPIVTATLQAATLSLFSNIFAQIIEARQEGRPFVLDPLQILRFVTLTFITAPPNYLWQGLLERTFPAYLSHQQLEDRKKEDDDVELKGAGEGLIDGDMGGSSAGQGDARGKFSLRNTLTKWFVDCITMGAIMNTIAFLVIMGVMKGQGASQIGQNIRTETIPIIVAGYKIWPIASIISFSFIPVHRRIVFLSFIGLLWGIYMSLVASRV